MGAGPLRSQAGRHVAGQRPVNHAMEVIEEDVGATNGQSLFDVQCRLSVLTTSPGRKVVRAARSSSLTGWAGARGIGSPIGMEVLRVWHMLLASLMLRW